MKVVSKILVCTACLLSSCSDSDDPVRTTKSRDPYLVPVAAGSWQLPDLPFGAAIDPDGSVLVAGIGYSTPRSIVEYSLDGSSSVPWHVEIGNETLGVVHVDYVQPEFYLVGGTATQLRLIVVCDENRNVMRYWQEPEHDAVEVPFVSLAVDRLGNVYRLWFSDELVVKYRYDGTFERQWKTHGTDPVGHNWPGGIAVGRGNVIYVSDTLHNRILAFNQNGVLIDEWGSYGSQAGEFQWPHALAIDDDGYLYVVDRANERIQKFDGDGTFILEFPSETTGPYDTTPVGIACGAGTILVFHDEGGVNRFTLE